MVEKDCSIEKQMDVFSDENICLLSDEHLALHIMHRFNIDCDTLECMPACHTPLQSLLWPEKKK